MNWLKPIGARVMPASFDPMRGFNTHARTEGLGDEHLSILQALGQVDGAVIVTTPQELAALDARKAFQAVLQPLLKHVVATPV